MFTIGVRDWCLRLGCNLGSQFGLFNLNLIINCVEFNLRLTVGFNLTHQKSKELNLYVDDFIRLYCTDAP